MDILSHGLWAGIPFIKKSRKRFWFAFLFGIIPDLIAFGPHTVLMILGPERHSIGSPPPLTSLYPVTFMLYNITHSFITFFIIFGLIYCLKRKPMWILWGWGFHILADIPTHTTLFFPTPFLWPFSSLKVDGFSWGQPWFIGLNYSLLLTAYIALRFYNRKIKFAKQENA